jgi:uncharacterized protein YecE (DUF72 family)
MDFGKLPSVENVDFALPPDHPATAAVLAQPPPSAHGPQVYVGCPVWTCREWLGKWYPATAKEKDYLHFYARQFNTIELNTTHYRIPDPATIERWRAAVNREFAFCPKWPQQISHDNLLQNIDAPAQAFVESIRELKQNLGLSFLQLPPGFSPRQHDILAKFIEKFAAVIPLAVEFRHADWFRNHAEAAEIFDLMRNHNVATVITDVAGRRDVLHLRLTTPIAVIRFVGNALHPTDYQRIDDWIIRISQWLEQGLRKLYFFVHEPDPNTLSPELSVYLIRKLNEACNLQLEEPKPLPQMIQGSLF